MSTPSTYAALTHETGKSTRPTQQELVTTVFLKYKGDTPEHFLLFVWEWYHQWVLNDRTNTVFDGDGFIDRFADCPYKEIGRRNRRCLPKFCSTGKDQLAHFYRGCKFVHGFLYSRDNPLPFRLVRKPDRGICVISMTDDYWLLQRHLVGWLQPLSIKQRLWLKENHYFSLYSSGPITCILFGPLSLVNNACDSYIDWDRTTEKMKRASGFAGGLRQLSFCRATTHYWQQIPFRAGDKTAIKEGEEVTVRYEGFMSPPSAETWGFVCACAECSRVSTHKRSRRSSEPAVICQKSKKGKNLKDN
jgi:hypothetical protein